MDNTFLHLRLMRRTLLSVFSLSWKIGDETNEIPPMLLLCSSKHPELLWGLHIPKFGARSDWENQQVRFYGPSGEVTAGSGWSRFHPLL